MSRHYFLVLVAILGSCLSACGSDLYSIGGTISGVTGGSVTLEDNGGDSLQVTANGSFTFASKLNGGDSYVVTVLSAQGLSCTVSQASGSVPDEDVTSVQVTCASTFTIGGTISGVTGGSVTLADNGGDRLQLTADGAFTFATKVKVNSTYNVTVVGAPAGLTCTVANATGPVVSANVTSVKVSCVPTTYTIGGTIIGLPPGLILVLNDNTGMSVPLTQTDSLTVTSSKTINTFTFAKTVNAGVQYNVTLPPPTQPLPPTCTIGGGSGTVTGNVTSVVIACRGAQFAYVANATDNTLSSYWIDPDNVASGPGNLNPIADVAATTGTFPVSLATNPAGTFLYAANKTSGNVSGFSINLINGSLTPIPGTPVAAGTMPSSVTVDPTGRFVYVANKGSNNVSAYSINSSTGALVQLPNSPYSVGTGPQSITCNPAGSGLYVSNATSSNISVFNIDAATGALTQIGSSPFATGGTNAQSITINPTGTFLYLASYGDSKIRVFQIATGTGALTPAQVVSVPNQYPEQVVLNPAGTYAYTVNDSYYTEAAYSVDASTGNLTAVGTFFFPNTPNAVAINSTGTAIYATAATNRAVSYLINPTTGALSFGNIEVNSGAAVAIVITQAP
jgi:6-phosphogluconolactonase (cycloisomerase 2 family)